MTTSHFDNNPSCASSTTYFATKHALYTARCNVTRLSTVESNVLKNSEPRSDTTPYPYQRASGIASIRQISPDIQICRYATHLGALGRVRSELLSIYPGPKLLSVRSEFSANLETRRAPRRLARSLAPRFNPSLERKTKHERRSLCIKH